MDCPLGRLDNIDGLEGVYGLGMPGVHCNAAGFFEFDIRPPSRQGLLILGRRLWVVAMTFVWL
jgi:hypothetical protein